MFKNRIQAQIISTKFQKIKQHVLANRTAYLAGAGGLLVGVTGVLVVKSGPTTINNTNTITLGF